MDYNRTIKRFLNFLGVIFILLLFISLIQSDFSHMTSYEIGHIVGVSMKKLLLISGKIALILLVFKKIRDNRSIGFR